MATYLPGDIVSRRKGLVMHRGVALGDGRVLHNTPFKGEHICSEAQFRAGRHMVVTRLSMTERKLMLAAADGLPPMGRGYNLFTNNCEHTLARLSGKRDGSPQLRAWVSGVGVAALTLAVTRHPGLAMAGYALGHRLASGRR